MYGKLDLDKNLPVLVEKFIRHNVEMLFGDIHYMLRLPMEDLLSGCNFSAANALLDLISGFSALLTPDFDTTNDSSNKFKEILKDYYPWDLQTPVGAAKERAIGDIYKYFRNPLTHSLGIKTQGNYLIEISKSSMSESYIEELEKNNSSPGHALIYYPKF